MSDLELSDAEAAGWFRRNESAGPGTRTMRLATRDKRPRLHMLLGDSVARRADLASRFPGDEVLNRANGGETWSSVLAHLNSDIAAWQTAATARGLLTGNVIIWMSGNDVYNRLTYLASFTKERLETIGRTARAVVQRLEDLADHITVLGPLPRLAGEVAEATWESTAAYHCERTLMRMEASAKFVPLGRCLTRKISKNRHGLKGCAKWYMPDGIHLSPEGYEKVGDALPVWMTFRK